MSAAGTLAAVQRLPDWPARLYAFFEAHEGKAFVWGSNDCITFAAGAVQAITGQPALEGLSPWHDEPTAAQQLRAARGLVGAVSSRLGLPLATPLLAQRGDVLLVQARLAGKRVRFVAVCDADRWAGPYRGGLGRGPLAQAVNAWGVGHA